ncbi:MAG: LysR family transcriptional regulator [Firmicutes bacterium]|nr:LysR family transcriptional regulator [Bacillota bacterium]
MNLHFLELFCEVVRTGSFSAAAEALHVSRPAVSTQIHRLEADVGLPLLERRQGRWELTEAGSVLYGHALAILNHRSRAQVELAALRDGHFPLSIGASPGGALEIAAEALKAFRPRYPDLSVQVLGETPEELIQRTREGIVKLCLVWGNGIETQFGAKKVGSCWFYPLAAPSHPLAEKSQVDPEQFQKVPLYLFQFGQGWLSPVKQHLIAQHLLGPETFDLPSVDAVKSLVRAGAGVTVLSYPAAHEELERGQLVALNVPGVALHRDLYAIWNRERRPSRSEEHFLAALEQAMAAFTGLPHYVA